MRVAIVSQPWDTLEAPVTAGSIPIWTYETAKRLARDCEVVIYARRNAGQRKQARDQGVEYRRVSILGNRIGCGMARTLSRLYRRFRYLNSRLYYAPYPIRIALDLKRQGCDIVHIQNFSQFVPVIRALNPQIKIVLHMHCDWLSQFDYQVIAKRIQQIDLVVGCSDYTARRVQERFPEFAQRCCRVYNGVDVEQFTPADRTGLAELTEPTEPANNELKLLYIGRISPEKGLHTLIQAFDRIADEFPTATLTLIGPDSPVATEFIAELSKDPIVQKLTELDSPNYPKNLRKQVPQRLKDRVTFIGAVSHLALQTYIQDAAVLVNPSLSEAFGMSLIEAAASGIPVIATEVGGMTDVVVPGETGLLVPADDPQALAAAISQLLSDKDLRQQMGAAGRARAVEKFSWEAISADLLGRYRALLQQPQPQVVIEYATTSRAEPQRVNPPIAEPKTAETTEMSQ